MQSVFLVQYDEVQQVETRTRQQLRPDLTWTLVVTALLRNVPHINLH